MILRFGIALCCLMMLVSCAGQQAFRDGKQLVERDQIELGLSKLSEALTHDPRNPEYRQAVLQTRERAVYRLLEQAERDHIAGHDEAAAQRYQRVLGLDPSNEPARAGMRRLDMANRHTQTIAQARSAVDKKEFDSARTLLGAVFTEDPANKDALALQRALSEAAPAAATESALGKAYKKPISIEFKDVSLKQVFEVISRTSGLNFLFDKEVHTDQKTSIFLKNSTIESAVHFTLLTNQLEQRILDANTLLIYPNTAAKQHEYQDLIVRSFFLTNADAKVVANTLKTIVKSRDVVIDEKLNMLIVRDSADAIRVAEKLVALHDVPEPEVMLEVEILEVKRTRLLELGIQWPSSLSLTPLSLAGTAAGGLTLRDLRRQNGGTLGAGIGPITAKARQDDSDAKLLANPRIRTRNHEKAKILIGERVPNITTTATSTGFVSESINYVDVGLTLNVEPTIYLDNDVAIKVQLEVSNIVSQLKTQSGSVAYQIGTRTANTVLRLKDGETQVLAGLINDEDRRSGTKVPGLGELPLVGRLFGSGTDDNQKTEIVLSITPHLIRNIQRPDASAAEFRSGTDTSFKSSPSAGGAGAASPPASTLTSTSTSTSRTQSALSANSPPGSPSGSPSGAPPGAPPGSTRGSTQGSPPSSPQGSPTTAPPIAPASLSPGQGLTAAPRVKSPSTTTASTLSAAPEAKLTEVEQSGNTSAPPSPERISAPTLPQAIVTAGAILPAVGQVQLQWQGPASIKSGETFSLQLLMQSDKPVTGLPMALAYDNKVLQVINVSEGEFLKEGGARTSFNSRVEQRGRILLTVTRIGDGGATNLAEVATVTFKALTPATATSVQMVSNTPIGVAGTSLVGAPAPPFKLHIQ